MHSLHMGPECTFMENVDACEAVQKMHSVQTYEKSAARDENSDPESGVLGCLGYYELRSSIM